MALEGILSYLDIACLLKLVGVSRKSGVLEITWEERTARLFFQQGDLIRAESNRVHEGIGLLLVNARLLNHETLERALALQERENLHGENRRLGAILCDDFGVQPEHARRLLRRQFELIALDVFSWPGGRFVFHFEEPLAAVDRFHLDAVEFIEGMDIQAGVLVEQGLEQEKADPERPHLLFLEQDPELLARYQDHWRRKGYRVTCFTRCDEVPVFLRTCGDSILPPVLMANMLCPCSGDRGILGGFEVLQATRDLTPRIRGVILSESTDPRAQIAARSAGARAFVRKPKAADLRGPQGEVYFEVFMISLGKALEQVLANQVPKSSEGLS